MTESSAQSTQTTNRKHAPRYTHTHHGMFRHMISQLTEDNNEKGGGELKNKAVIFSQASFQALLTALVSMTGLDTKSL